MVGYYENNIENSVVSREIIYISFGYTMPRAPLRYFKDAIALHLVVQVLYQTFVPIARNLLLWL